MFNKSKPSSRPPVPASDTVEQPAPATEAPAPATQRALSVLSADLKFEGGLTGSGDVQIDGAVNGDVRVGRLIVGETGAVDGNVTADYVEVRGRVVGAVAGKQVRLIATAYVDGDISAEQLSIDIGAYFQGRVLQSRREAPAPIAPEPRPAAEPQPVPAPETPAQ